MEGSFVRFFLKDGTFKTLKVMADTTASDICHTLLTKLNIDPESHAYGLFELRVKLMEKDESGMPISEEQRLHDDCVIAKVRASWPSDDKVLKCALVFKDDLISENTASPVAGPPPQESPPQPREIPPPNGTPSSPSQDNVTQRVEHEPKQSPEKVCNRKKLDEQVGATKRMLNEFLPTRTDPDLKPGLRRPTRERRDSLVCEGFLWKRGGPMMRWLKRWFSLRRTHLYYFVNKDDTCSKGSISLVNLKIERDTKEKWGFQIVTDFKTYTLRAESEEELKMWMHHLNHFNVVRTGAMNKLLLDLKTNPLQLKKVQGDSKKAREETLKKACTAWINATLKDRDLSVEGSLEKALSSGVLLINLLEVLSGVSLGKYTRVNPLPLQQFDNCKIVENFLRKNKVNLGSYSANDIMRGDTKSCLFFLWRIIHMFLLSEFSEDEVTAKEDLLAWCHEQTDGLGGVDICNFDSSFMDGLAFCGLLHRLRPGTLDYSALTSSKALDNLELAFETAEKQLGIPRVLHKEDVAEGKVDERCVMLFILLLHKKTEPSVAVSPPVEEEPSKESQSADECPTQAHVEETSPTSPEQQVETRQIGVDAKHKSMYATPSAQKVKMDLKRRSLQPQAVGTPVPVLHRAHSWKQDSTKDIPCEDPPHKEPETTNASSEVQGWLESFGMAQYLDKFKENGFDTLFSISLLEDVAELQDIGITALGHRKIIWNAIKGLK